MFFLIPDWEFLVQWYCHNFATSLYPYIFRALSIRPNIPKFSKRGQMVWKFPGKGSRKSGNYWISEMRTIQPKTTEIPGWKLNGKEISRKKCSKFGCTSGGCPLFRRLCKFAIFYSALVLLAEITASWTSHARMTATRIRKWINILR